MCNPAPPISGNPAARGPATPPAASATPAGLAQNSSDPNFGGWLNGQPVDKAGTSPFAGVAPLSALPKPVTPNTAPIPQTSFGPFPTTPSVASPAAAAPVAALPAAAPQTYQTLPMAVPDSRTPPTSITGQTLPYQVPGYGTPVVGASPGQISIPRTPVDSQGAVTNALMRRYRRPTY